MAFKKLKDVDIERFLACDRPSGSEFSDDDVEITDENLFASNQNLNDDYLSDDLCFDHEEFEQLMNEYDKDAQNYQVFDEALEQSFKKVENKQNVLNIDERSASTEIASYNNKIVKKNHKRLLRGYKINKKHQQTNKVATTKKNRSCFCKKIKNQKTT
jgi:membrane-bound lytic murein transglycosylase B